MIAAGEGHSPKARAGVQWLLHNQNADGTWDESLTTGTGFPNVFYLSYGLYRNYFPLLAMATFKKLGNPIRIDIQMAEAISHNDASRTSIDVKARIDLGGNPQTDRQPHIAGTQN